MVGMEGAGKGWVVFFEPNARAFEMNPVFGYCITLY